MATQKRTGGVEKIGLPLADEHSVRKVIRSLAGIFDLDLVTRMFKDESIPCSKLVGGGCGGGSGIPAYAALISQSGENAPVLTELQNDLSLVATPTYVGDGSYTVEFSPNIFENYTGHIDISGNIINNYNILTSIDQVTFDLIIFTFDSGVQSNDILTDDFVLLIQFFER
jgi:hypothetical protein